MPELDPETMARYVTFTHGIQPTKAETARLIATVGAVRKVLSVVAAQSLFDTEPANLDSVLESLAEPLRGAGEQPEDQP